MQNMNQEDKRPKALRLSDASTVDMDFSSDEEISSPPSNLSLFSSFTTSSSFNKPWRECEEVYSTLATQLESIFAQLELELEPVNIREYKCLASTSVNLNNVLNSKLCRRRATMPPNSTNNL